MARHTRRDDPNQLRMLMTAGEIQSQYDPHEGDRLWHGTSLPFHSTREQNVPGWLGRKDPREGQITGRPQRTDEEPNFPLRNSGRFMRPLKDLRGTTPRPETDPEMYQRKYIEAEHQGLVSDIQAQGVTTPIPLTVSRTTQNPHLGGQEGKPMVGGGQHRLAVMSHLNPDQLLPVVHVKDVMEAKGSGL